MDLVTQMVLGASVGEATLGKKVGNKAIAWGAVAGIIPDLDVLAFFFTDPLTSIELHRGFTHSIFFSLLLAPLLGWLISKIHKNESATWRNWTLLMFLGLLTHALLDAHNYIFILHALIISRKAEAHGQKDSTTKTKE